MTVPARRVSWAAVMGVGALCGLALLVFFTIREGPDRTLVGTATTVQGHRLCLDPPDGAHVCVMADSPAAIRDVHVGDCIRIRYSAENILISTEPMIDGCR